ncbi:MAG: hypothetical protein OEM16_14635 [Myxococcales bacterium]|nr:hypothetical protein [Myxococcales bacterium]
MPRRPFFMLLIMPLLFGAEADCEREMTRPTKGYIVIEDADSPVVIAARKLNPPVQLQVRGGDGAWHDFYTTEYVTLAYNGPVPYLSWHRGGSGFATTMRVVDEVGVLSAPTRAHGEINVCTSDYEQTIGRVHCGERSLQASSEGVTLSADRYRTSRFATEGHGGMSWTWHGDGFSRLVKGQHTWAQSNDPWHPPRTSDAAGQWMSARWTGPIDVGTLGEDEVVFNVDLGACSIFIPWEWKDRDPQWDFVLGPMLQNRGIAEVLFDEIAPSIEAAARQEKVEDVKFWVDTWAGIHPRTDSFPEFHFHVNEAAERQVCLRTYWAANSSPETRPDADYVWGVVGQAFLAGWIELFGIGDCKTHPLSVRFCGELGAADGKPTFTLDEASAHVEMEPYCCRPKCNNDFIPKLKEGLEISVLELTSEAITRQLEELTGGLPWEIRRIETTPKGVYVVTAESDNDRQYGGVCRPDLGTESATQIERATVSFTAAGRGITQQP